MQRAGPRPSMFQRLKGGVQGLLQPEPEVKRAQLVRRKKPGLYGDDDEEDSKR